MSWDILTSMDLERHADLTLFLVKSTLLLNITFFGFIYLMGGVDLTGDWFVSFATGLITTVEIGLFLGICWSLKMPDCSRTTIDLNMGLVTLVFKFESFSNKIPTFNDSLLF